MLLPAHARTHARIGYTTTVHDVCLFIYKGVCQDPPRKLLVLGTTVSGANLSLRRSSSSSTQHVGVDSGTSVGEQGVTGVNGIIVSDDDGLWKLLFGNLTQDGWQGTMTHAAVWYFSFD